MKADEFKKEVEEILEVKLKFDGHVNSIINHVSEEKQNLILEWVKSCNGGEAIPEPCKNFRNMMAFIYKSSDNKIRGVLTKEKSSYFLELFLDKHKYYDRKRKKLGL